MKKYSLFGFLLCLINLTQFECAAQMSISESQVSYNISHSKKTKLKVSELNVETCGIIKGKWVNGLLTQNNRPLEFYQDYSLDLEIEKGIVKGQMYLEINKDNYVLYEISGTYSKGNLKYVTKKILKESKNIDNYGWCLGVSYDLLLFNDGKQYILEGDFFNCEGGNVKFEKAKGIIVSFKEPKDFYSASQKINITTELQEGSIGVGYSVYLLKDDLKLDDSEVQIPSLLINDFFYNIPKGLESGEYSLVIQSQTNQEVLGSKCLYIKNERSFKPGVTLVTHGFQPKGGDAVVDFVNGTTNQIGICAAIKKRIEAEGGRATIFMNDIDKSVWIKVSQEPYREGDEIILFYNWSTVSNDLNDGALESAADNLFAMLADAKYTDQRFPSKLLDSNLPFHLIAHSRGNILMIQMLHRALKYFPNKKFEHFTLLDPHPASMMNDINNDNQQLSLPGVYGSPNFYPDQPFLRLPTNVLKSDLYYRKASQQYEPLIDLALFSKASSYLELGKLYLNVSAKANLVDVDWDQIFGYFGNFSGIDVINSSLSLKLQEEFLRNGASNKLPHTGVHEWYRGTILPESVEFSTSNRSEWYSGPLQLRTKYGYNLTRVGGGLSTINTIENPLNISDLDSRIINRTGSSLKPIFNSNFQYSAKEANFIDLIKTPSYYGYTGFGGISPDRLYVKKGRLELDNSRNKDGVKSQFVVHNYMFFPPKSNYLVIDVSSFKDRTFLAVEFYGLNSNSEPIESKAFMLNRTGVYFVKIPEQLIGNTGTFRVKLSESTKEHAVTIESITISEAEIVAKSPISFNWRNNEVNSSNPIGVVADGTNKILINVELEGVELKLKSHKAEIKISDVDNKVISSQYLGSMMPVITTSQKSQPLSLLHNSQLSAINDTKLDGGFIFEYQAPIDFSRPLDIIDDSQTAIREVLVSVNLYDIGQNLIQTYSKKLRIVRPPLMLAHGLGGKGVGFEKGEDESTWRNFRYTNRLGGTDFFRYSNLFQVKRDINLLPTASFDANSDVLLGKSSEPNMEKESFDAMIKLMNDLGYACAKVDYVAHSMGGSVLRNTLEKADYKNPKNYNQGYVNKFITICTPHQGSPLGDIMSEFTPYINFTPSIDRNQLKGINLIVKYWNFKEDYVLASEAIKDLALYSGKKFISSQVYNHQIIGSLIKNQNSTKDALISIIDENIKEVPGFFELTETLIKAAKVKFSVCACINELEEIKSIDKILNKAEKTISFFNWINSRLYPNSPEFMKNSDFVVSVESQSNGKIKEFTSDYKNLSSNNSVTFIDDVTHNFNPKATQSITIGNRVLDLLNSSVTSSKFDISIEKTSKIQAYPNCLADCNLFNQANNFDFSISPNPAQNDFKLDLTEMGEAKEYQIKIFDEKGNLMHTQSVNNDCCPTISPSIKQPGIYSINITSEKGIKTKKIIINK